MIKYPFVVTVTRKTGITLQRYNYETLEAAQTAMNRMSFDRSTIHLCLSVIIKELQLSNHK